MNEVFKVVGRFILDNKEANDGIDETSRKAEGAHGKMAGAFAKIGSAAVAMGKVIATGVAAGSAAIVALTKQSVGLYAEYEQLVGGVETLFGAGGKSLEEYAESVGMTTKEASAEYARLMNAQRTVLDNADDAYKNAGMSANEYINTVTGFSASLLQSLDGDTQEAARKADMAIRDMSDNANKMGTSMESIQYAYQGFAKQNYTMLDNLKLGYGGTKSEMQRLLEDAEKISGIEYDISSYGDVVDAIHVIQDEMGITGTTADEAATTIQGSMRMAKAAWTNLLTGIGDENQDLDVLIGNFVDSAATAAGNLIPRIEKILGGLGTMVEKLAPIIVEKLPGMVESMLPSVISAATSLIVSLIQALPTLLQVLIDQIPMIFTQIGEACKVVFPELLAVVKDLLGQLIEFISSEVFGMDVDADALFEKIGAAFENFDMQSLVDGFNSVKEAIQPVIDAFMTIATSTIENVTPAFQSIHDTWNDLASALSTAYTETIEPVVSAFADMFGKLLEESGVLEKIGELYGAVWDFIAGKFEYFNTVVVQGIFIPAIQAITQWVTDNMGTIQQIFQAAFDYIGGIIDFFVALFKGDWEGMWEAVKSILNSAFEMIKSVFELIQSAIASRVTMIWSKITSVFESIKTTIKTKLTTAKDTVISIFNDIKEKISEKINAAKDTVASVIEKIKGLFNFQWKLPDLKMPHFSISPAGWKAADLLEGTIPTLGVEWYAKGGVLTEPTIFGMNGNNAMIGGEAGDEAIAPIDVLQGYVSEAVASQNAQLVEVLQAILAAIVKMDSRMADNLLNAITNGLSWEVNGREFGRMVRKYA